MALEIYARTTVKDTLQDVALQVGLVGYRSAVACQDLFKGVTEMVGWREPPQEEFTQGHPINSKGANAS